MSSSSRFQKIVAAIDSIKACYQNGLQALGSHSSQVQASNTRHLQGSVDLDKCFEKVQPHASRWDYAIGYGINANEKVYYVEVHPASTADIPTVLAKHKWLRAWLQTQAHTLEELPSEYWWVATGAIKLLPTSRQAKQLRVAKIQGPTKRLRLR